MPQRETDITAQPTPVHPGHARPLQTGSVETDAPCHRCGYNLRGLAINGCCPECGIEVAVSLGGDHLRYCEPVYVRRLATGCNWIASGIKWSLVAVFFFRLFACAGAISPKFQILIASILVLAWSLAQGVGGWLMTASDPS